MEGTIKWFNDLKGYGFIEGSDGKDYFLHHSSIEGGASVYEGDAVSFEATEGDRGPKAEKVEKK